MKLCGEIRQVKNGFILADLRYPYGEGGGGEIVFRTIDEVFAEIKKAVLEDVNP